MTRLAQVCMMLALTVLWVPSVGASWAYCQRSGVVHPAGTECGRKLQEPDDCCDCCGGKENNGRHQRDCCIAGGKMLPDALLPVTGYVGPGVSVAPVFCHAAPCEPMIRSVNRQVHAWHLRGPPPDLAVFLVQRSLRL